jgi:nucleoid DNA-binding protein
MSPSSKSPDDLKPAPKDTKIPGGRKRLIKAVRNQLGLSKRKATKVVNQIIDVIKKGLVESGQVETPIGTLSVKEFKGTKARVTRPICNIYSKKKQPITTSRPGKRNVIGFHPGGQLDEEKLQAEQDTKIRELVQKIFGGRQADDVVMAALFQIAIETNSTLDQLIDCLGRSLKEGRVLPPAELAFRVAKNLGARPDKDWKYWLKLVEGKDVA